MKEHEVNKLDNFISGYYFSSNHICRRIIEYFDNSIDKCQGFTYEYGDQSPTVNKNIKDSIECHLTGDLLDEYINQVQMEKLQHYIKKYPYVNSYRRWGIIEPVNIQKYNIGGGFHIFHTERGSHLPPFSARHLVFMTYLNTVEQGGETEFHHQKLKIKPEQGLTLFWPADWTFTHRGLMAQSPKIIVTGWYSFY